MKLSTRMKMHYICAFVLPIVVIIGMALGVIFIGMNSLEKKYDLDRSSYDMVLNPMNMMSHIAGSTISELQAVIDEDPDQLKETDYLDSINEKLTGSYSYLVVEDETADQVIYSGLSENVPYIEDFKINSNSQEKGSVYVVSDHPFHIQQIEFTFSDGHSGKVLIYTDMTQLLPQYTKYIIGLLLLAVLILLVGGGISMYSMYRSIIRPIHKLKSAAENITKGNLSYSVTAESDDEIGELCEAFEEMRIKLKSQTEQNIQYEKDSKELISNISHDLKTPMTSIKGYVEGLMDGVADTKEKQDKYIRTIYNKVNDMNSLIEELFLYAKLDSNSVTYQFVKLNLDGYFQDCVDEISLDLEAQDIQFGYFNYANRDVVIIADPEQLKRVINNIIGNSIKYQSPDRKLSISIRITEEPEFVKVEIEDNGRGIARREVPLIFDRCYRTDASRTSSKGGSGLGLSIARKIIEEHGGKIWAVSQEGHGTTMCFVLRKYNETKTDGAES